MPYFSEKTGGKKASFVVACGYKSESLEKKYAYCRGERKWDKRNLPGLKMNSVK